MGIAVYLFIRMKKKRKVLDEEISKIINISERAEYRTKRWNFIVKLKKIIHIFS